MAKGQKVSKNSKTNRGDNRKFFIDGVEVSVIKYVGLSGSYMSALNKSTGALVMGNDGEPVKWHTANKKMTA
jgi:hypothetical protein